MKIENIYENIEENEFRTVLALVIVEDYEELKKAIAGYNKINQELNKVKKLSKPKSLTIKSLLVPVIRALTEQIKEDTSNLENEIRNKLIENDF